MVDNTQINQNQTPGDKIAVDAIVDGNGDIIKHQRVKLQTGVDGVATDVSSTNPAPTLLYGTTHPGTEQPVTVNREGSIDVHLGTSISAIGDAITVSPNPKIQLQFAYSIDTSDVIQFTNGSGTVTSANSQIEVRTGTTVLSDAAVASKDFLTYVPGYGATARFSFGCTTTGDLSGTFQQIGIGTQEDGFFFSYQDNDMNILRRQGGQRDQQTIDITTESTSIGNVTVQLDGTSLVVPVTDNTGSTNATAIEIASSSVFTGSGYTATATGNVVTTQADRTGLKSGAFSFSPGSTGAVGTMVQRVVGVDPVETLIPRTSWNIDQADGSGPQLPLIDWSKGNVYQIRYQWLGYGAQSFYIENPNSSNFVLLHRELYQNKNIKPSIFNPSLQFLINVTNTITTKNVMAFAASAAGLIDCAPAGRTFGARHAASYSASVGSSGFENVVSICSPLAFKSKSNRTEASIVRIVVTSSAAADIQIIETPVLGGDADWQIIDSNTLLQFDQTSTTVAGGIIRWAERAEKQDRFVIEAKSAGFEQIVKLHPGDVVTIAAKADGGTSSISVALNWVEPV